MKTATHSLVGVAFGLGISLSMPEQSAMAFVIGSAIGATAPDWMELAGYNKKTDSRWSIIPHRTITHWPWLWILLLAIAALVLPQEGVQALVTTGCIGFAAASLLHISMDYVTPMGVPIGLNPFGRRVSAKIMKTGSIAEIPISLLALIFALAALSARH